jgi:L-malate glycosyltransferase
MYRLLLLKRKVEDVFIFPFIIIGRLIALVKPLKEEYDIFLFFPFYHIGGAEKVHCEIAKVAGQKKSILFFTKKSNDNLFLPDFQQSGCEIRNVNVYTDNKWLYFNNLIYRGVISAYINKQKRKTLVFNGQCNFGYKISPWIKPAVTQIELIHAFNSFSKIRLPFLPFYTTSVMISKVKIKEHIDDYRKKNVPDSFVQKIEYVINGVEIPEKTNRDFNKPVLTVLYAGRSTIEKRVPLIATLAKNCITSGLPVRFLFMGDMGNTIPSHLATYCNCLGSLNKAEEIQAHYNDTDILILLSDTEGFPMVVMEAMVSGCAIVATAVGDIPVHVKEDINGFVITDVFDEDKILAKAQAAITKLCADRELLKQISIANRKYGEENFSTTAFHKNYTRLFNQYL